MTPKKLEKRYRQYRRRLDMDERTDVEEQVAFNEPDAKRTQYVWHLIVPVNAAVDLKQEEVAEHLYKLASLCIEGIVIDTHARANVVACEKITASTLQPLDNDSDEKAGPEGIIASLLPVVANRAADRNERVRAVVALSATFAAYDHFGAAREEP